MVLFSLVFLFRSLVVSCCAEFAERSVSTIPLKVYGRCDNGRNDGVVFTARHFWFSCDARATRRYNLYTSAGVGEITVLPSMSYPVNSLVNGRRIRRRI